MAGERLHDDGDVIDGGLRDPRRPAEMARYAILDTPAEPMFDDIVALAAAACDAPMAVITLLTADRQWFKARLGCSATESPIADSVCALTLYEADLLVIPDLRNDPRTARLGFVMQPGSRRFYAGAPLRMPSGLVMGSLCILDDAPRPHGLTPHQADQLRRLARQVVALLDMRRQVAERPAAITRATPSATTSAPVTGDQGTLSVSRRDWGRLFEKLGEGFVVGELVRDAAGQPVDWRYLHTNAAWEQLLGIPRADAIGRTLRQVVAGVDQTWIDDPATVVATGQPRTFLRTLGEPARDYECYAFHLHADRFAIVFFETTDRHLVMRRQAALLTLGDRLREATSIGEMTATATRIVGEALGASRAGFGRIDQTARTIEIEPDWTMPGIASIAGLHRFVEYGDLLADLLAGDALVIDDVRLDPRSATDPSAMLAIGIGALVNMPVREHGRTVAAVFVHDAAPRHWTPDDLAFLRKVADRIEVGVARLQAEDRQRLLNAELSHRLKNTLAMVQAIATQTLKHADDRAAVASFGERLGALATAHEVLLGRNWLAADLATIARSVLGVLDGGRQRVQVAGPPVELGARAAMSTSLLLHELCTNAVKYGALSTEDGTVAVTWTTAGDGLTLDWTERGGPPAAEPNRRGFGSRLINLGLAGTGGVTIRYEQAGFSATMRASLVELQQA